MLGLLAILDILRILTSEHNITVGACTIACDGISTLRKVFHSYSNTHPSQKHSDLLSATTKILKILPIKIITQHIKGHQDDHTLYDILPRLAQLNIDADIRAKLQLQMCIKDNIDPTILTPHYLSLPTITSNLHIVRQQVKETLYKDIADKRLITACQERETGSTKRRHHKLIGNLKKRQ